jgi:hypothetical protein
VRHTVTHEIYATGGPQEVLKHPDGGAK